ncbi:MAG TPA: ribosome assembly cofactor RimP [Synergistaceae bacterium]|jgi:ribosome maturation factor RimP|nr:ribosome assembly cofactor RimP [Synergistaceae bacterium]
MQDKKGQERWTPIREVIEGLGYECVGILLVSEGRSQYLRVYIDSLGGIVVKDCETVSRAISRFLDEHDDMVQGAFYLEVSSPGLERPLFLLEDYGKFVGRGVKIKLHETVKGQKKFSGVLEGVAEDSILLRESESLEVRTIPFDTVQKGHLVFEEDEGAKKQKRRSS